MHTRDRNAHSTIWSISMHTISRVSIGIFRLIHAGYSSPARSLRQFHTSAGIPFEPAAIGRPSQRESKNDPHAAKGALAVVAGFFRKEGLDIFTVDFGDFPIPESRKNVSA